MSEHKIKLTLVFGGILHQHVDWWKQQEIERFEKKNVAFMPQSYYEFRDCIDDLDVDYGISTKYITENKELAYEQYRKMVAEIEGSVQ